MTQCRNHYCKPFPFYFIFKIIRSIAHELLPFLTYDCPTTRVCVCFVPATQTQVQKVQRNFYFIDTFRWQKWHTITRKKNNDTIMDLPKMFPIYSIYISLDIITYFSVYRIEDMLVRPQIPGSTTSDAAVHSAARSWHKLLAKQRGK